MATAAAAGRFTLKAKLMAGLAALVCAMTLIIGGLGAGGVTTTRVEGLDGSGHGPAVPVAPADLFAPTVCHYPARLEPICPDAAPPALATQP